MSARRSAVTSLIGLALMGYLIFSADEAPGTALRTLQYAAVVGCLLGLIGSLVKMSRGDR